MKRLFATGVCAGGIAAIMTELSGPIGMISWVFFIAMVSSDLLQRIAQEYFGDG